MKRSKTGGWHILMGIAMLFTALETAAAVEGKVKLLGKPCRAKNVLAGRVVVDRKDGHEWFVITNMNENSGAELIFIDPAKDKGKAIRAPKGAGSWALQEVSGDRLIVGTFYDGQFMVFDLKKMEFVKSVGVPGETYIWNLAIGGDGRVYGGTYGNGKLGALDLNTYTVEDCGAPAPPNLYLRNVSATPDGRILCNFGLEKPTNLLYDPISKKYSALPVQLEGVSMGVTWNDYFLAGTRAYHGPELEVVQPLPFPTPPADKGGWYVDPYLTTSDVVYLRQNNAVYRYAKGDKALTFIADIDLRGGRLLAGNKKGELLGVRGQDYFLIKPGDTTLKLHPIPAESGPRTTHFLKADENNRLWGGPTFGQTLYHLDVKTKKTVNTATICDGGGEVYDATFLNGKVFAAAYAGGNVVRYDPAQPWDQWNDKNPKTLVGLSARGYIRPTGGILPGPDGKIYSGWMAKYGTYGGAIAITDPESGDTSLIENPLGEQAISGLAVDAHFAYVGTSLGANGLPDKPGESPKFGVIDLATKKPVFTHTFEGGGNVGSVHLDTKTKRVTLVNGGKLHVYDTTAKALAPDWTTEPPTVTSGSLATGNGKAYYGHDKSVIALDLLTGQATTLADAPAKINNVTLGKDGTVYFSCDTDVYRVK